MSDRKISDDSYHYNVRPTDAFAVVINMLTGTKDNLRTDLNAILGHLCANVNMTGNKARIAANTFLLGSNTFVHALQANNVQLRIKSVPANSSVTCAAGELRWDGTYLYIASANNNLKRLGPFSTF